MKKKGLVICTLLLSFSMFGQFTLIPDTHFEQFLVDNGIDTDGIINGQVLTADIEDELSLILDSNFGAGPIEDLTGIQDFTSLENLDIFRMNISTLNLSENLNLKHLVLDDLAIEALDLSNNLNLEFLALIFDYPSHAYSSSLSSLDLQSNSSLRTISFNYTSLSEGLDFSNNNNLEEVRLRNMGELPYVNLQNGNNTNIHFLQITNNPNLDCVQVDDPAAVMAGTDPPYDSWTIDNGPIITDDCQLGIADYLQSQIKLYPNPVANKLYLQTSDRVDIEAIRIYDLMGKKMLETKANSVLDVSLLSKGVYLVSITTNKGILTEKLIKE